MSDPGLDALRAYVHEYVGRDNGVVFTRGIAGSGKTTLLRRLFPGTQVFSLDLMREMLHDDVGRMEDVQECQTALIALMRARQRVSTSKWLLVDGTHLVPEHTRAVLEHSRSRRRILLDVHCDPDTHAFNTTQRTERVVPPWVIERMQRQHREDQETMMSLFRTHGYHIVRVDVSRSASASPDAHQYTHMRVYRHTPQAAPG